MVVMSLALFAAFAAVTAPALSPPAAVAATAESGKEDASKGPLPVGVQLPEIRLPAPATPEESRYLGIGEKEPFTLSQVKAKIVILEVFSMYCPYCQKEAPRVNELYRLIEESPELKDNIKIIGLGAGNSTFEVKVFKTTYGVPFPLIPDPDLEIHKALGEPRTPYFIAVGSGTAGAGRGAGKVIYSKGGGIDDPRQFVDLLLKASGGDSGAQKP